MSRPNKYREGDMVNGYVIVARTGDARKVYVRCQHEGCNAAHEVHMSTVIQGHARKFCDHHKALDLQRRRIERAQAKQVAVSLAAMERAAAAQPRAMDVTGSVRDDWSFRELLDVAAVRMARTAVGLPWNSYIHEGKCFGWYITQSRNRTFNNAVRWTAICAVCGTGRNLYDAQLARGETNRCPHCMRTKERYQLAVDRYRLLFEKGYDLSDPAKLLNAGVGLARDMKDEGAEKWGRDAYVTFKEMVRHAKELLVQQDAAPVPVVNAVPEVDWDEKPVEVWPYDILEAKAMDMSHHPEKYSYMPVLARMQRTQELINEVKRRDALKESGDVEQA